MAHSTRQRRAIIRAIEEADQPITALKIYETARSLAPTLGMATVYRCLRELLGSGEIRSIDVPGSLPHYESSQRARKPSFLCGQCAKLFSLAGEAGDIGHLAPQGFEVSHHEILLFGRCRACRSLQASPATDIPKANSLTAASLK